MIVYHFLKFNKFLKIVFWGFLILFAFNAYHLKVSADDLENILANNASNESILNEASFEDSSLGQNENQNEAQKENQIEETINNQEINNSQSENTNEIEVVNQTGNNQLNETEENLLENQTEEDINSSQNEKNDLDNQESQSESLENQSSSINNEENGNQDVVLNNQSSEDNQKTEDTQVSENSQQSKDCQEQGDDQKLDNSFSGSSLETGQSNVSVNEINFFNSNFNNSFLINFILNNFSEIEGDINLEEEIKKVVIEFPDFSQIINENQGVINNVMNIQAITGYNKVFLEDGNVIIRTGDANVALNVINFVNSNFNNLKLSFLIINNFGNLLGDLIFPGENEWQDNFGDNLQENKNNEATVNNQINIETETGNNVINTNNVNGEENTLISAGESNVNLNVYNLLNSNLKSNWFFGVFNNFGIWNGHIFSLPSGFNLNQSSNLLLFSSNNISSFSNDLQTISNSQGQINNQINVEADTGNNEINLDNGEAVIKTGNINIAVNLLNFINSNFDNKVGILALVNNYGSWRGDIAFGRPDLILDRSFSPTNELWPGKEVNFSLSFSNQGTAPATLIVLKEKLDPSKWIPVNLNGGIFDSRTGEIVWHFDRLNIGENKTINYTLEINPQLPANRYELTNQAEISCFEDDSNPFNNINSSTIIADNTFLLRGFSSDSFIENKSPQLEVIKRHFPKDDFYPNEKIDYQIEIKNKGNDPAYRITVYDILLRNGEIIYSNAWYIDKILPNETIKINYSMVINIAKVGDTYKNTSHAEYYDSVGHFYNTPDSYSVINIVSNPIIQKSGEELKEEKLNEISNSLEAVQKEAEKINEEIIRLSLNNSNKGNLSRGLITQVLASEEPQEANQGDFINTINTFDGSSGAKGYNPLLAFIGNFPFSWLGFLIVVSVSLVIIIVSKKRKNKTE